jgi:hypothetical protein
LAPADFILDPEAEIHSERSPISYDRWKGRKFTMGPLHYTAKHFPGSIPELEKPFEAV